MQRGHDLEPEARELLKEKLGTYLDAATIQHPKHEWMTASIDAAGANSDGKIICEIKCPNEKAHNHFVETNEVPEHYYAQVQHQMYVADVKRCFFASYHPGEIIQLHVVAVEADEKFQEKMVKEEVKFWSYMEKNTPPPLCDRDYEERNDAAFLEEAAKQKALKEKRDEIDKEIEESRKRLIELSNGQPCKGGGITLCKVFSSGRVDYKAIPELQGVDLDKYRKPSSETWRILTK